MLVTYHIVPQTDCRVDIMRYSLFHLIAMEIEYHSLTTYTEILIVTLANKLLILFIGFMLF